MATFAVLAFFCLLALSDATMCFECQNIPYPSVCTKVRACNSDELCFTEQIVMSSGNIVFKSGCLSKSKCPAASGMIVGRRSKNMTQRSTSDISTCIECCIGDYCNNQGCGSQASPLGQRGPYCFNCDSVLNPLTCFDLAVCETDEQCMLYSPPEFGGLMDTVYRSQCEKKAACSTLSNLYSHGSCPPKCCDADFCNNQCGVASNDTMTTIVHDTTPAYIQTQTAVSTQGSCKQDHFYDDISGICIKIDETRKLNYVDAKKACEAIGDQLVTIDSHEKTVFIEYVILHHSRFADVSNRLYYTGALDKYHNGVFVWPNGHKTHYTNWAGIDENIKNPQPDGGNQYCIILYGPDYYKWADDECRNTHYFICEDPSSLKENVVPLETIPPPTHHSSSFHCDAHGGYMLLKSGHEHLCVHIVTHHANWDSARKICKAEGGDLVILDNAEKASLMRSNVNEHGYNGQQGYWIGAKDFSFNNHFFWVDQKQVTYGDWHPGQPNHHDGGQDQDCACMWSSGEHYHWHDDYCAKPLGYICEKR